MNPLQGWIKRNLGVELDAYIDDFQIVITGDRIGVMCKAVDALQDLDGVIEQELTTPSPNFTGTPIMCSNIFVLVLKLILLC